MTVSATPNTDLNRVRLNVGDSTGELITDSVILYLLTENNGDVDAATLKALTSIIRDTAKLRDEETDEVSVKWSQVHDHYVALKKTLIASSLGSGGANNASFFFGGTSKTENEKFYNDPDANGCPIRVGDSSRVSDYCYNSDDPYNLIRG